MGAVFLHKVYAPAPYFVAWVRCFIQSQVARIPNYLMPITDAWVRCSWKYFTYHGYQNAKRFTINCMGATVLDMDLGIVYTELPLPRTRYNAAWVRRSMDHR